MDEQLSVVKHAGIPVTMALRRSARNAADIARAQQLAAELGFEPTGHGRATLSFRISPIRFAELFHVTPTPVKPNAPHHAESGTPDAGTPGGWLVGAPFGGMEIDLPVPNSLAPYVTSISVTPPATRFY